MISENQIVIRILLAALYGGFIGYERERLSMPAGLRTHIIVAIGSALTMCVSINLAMEFNKSAPNGDPARLAAQVVSGIGFLGAGVIFRYGFNVKGITTAASLWTVAMIGLAVGAGHYFSAFFASMILLFSLIILYQVEKRFFYHHSLLNVNIAISTDLITVDDMINEMHNNGLETGTITLKVNKHKSESKISFTIDKPKKDTSEKLNKLFSELDGIKHFEIM